MPVVAAPIAVIGVAAAIWYVATLFFGVTTSPLGQFSSGFVFGLGVFLLLSALHSAPIAQVFGPRWGRSLSLGTIAAAAFWFLGASAFGPAAAWLMAGAGGMTAVLADRRTVVDKTIRDLYRFLLALVLLGALGELIIAWLVDEQPLVGIGTAVALLVASITPIGDFPKWTSRLFAPIPAIPLRPAMTQNLTSFGGYQPEALAFCTFLAPNNIPRSLVISVALEVGTGKASGLKTLAPTAFTESGSDSLTVDPLMQRFAFQRLAVGERKQWAARAVRTLAAQFPSDYETNMHWCERLTPHAFAAAEHANELKVERGAAALLLSHVAGYLVLVERPEEACRALERALVCATAAFGPNSGEVATLHANLAEITQHVAGSGRESGTRGSLTQTDSSALAVDFAQLGDMRRDLGDVAEARRNYHAALGHAKQALGSRHELVADLRSKLAALPPLGQERVAERHLLVGGLGMIVIAVAVFVGIVLWRDARISVPRPASHSLAVVDDLGELCDERPRYFPEAAPFAGVAPHPIQLFAKSADNSEYLREQLFDPSAPVPSHWQADDFTVRSAQLVGCVTLKHAAAEITVCKYPDRRDIPLHQATYEIAVYEVKTGRKVGTKNVVVTEGSCPPGYTPPPIGDPWRLHALPNFQQYEQALSPFVEDDLQLG
ncbi:MAG TPA: hypothetical protein DGG94_15210 [Micromonosporaceae bacterium]|nr:hypothetical protein [Micromonosporaceae bacterium]HCU51120.1 hypothetical protein [Micromonosporaceae bacterium]